MASGDVAPLIVIVGPTASGKTSLAVELAEECGGEIICADSRTIYKGMDIGTAKPSAEERERVPHWGLDIVSPGESFSVSDFKDYADEKITAIRNKGKIPFLVGGSGLYVDSVLFGYEFADKADPQRRAFLESLSLDELYKYCKSSNIILPENAKNKRYVVRAIERNGLVLRRKQSPAANTIIVGIATEKTILRQRITARTEQLFSQPIVEEAKSLGENYGWQSEAMTGNIYPLLRSYVEKEISLEEAMKRFEVLDWKLAKRQLTWFRRNPYIVWLLKEESNRYIKEVLAAQ